MQDWAAAAETFAAACAGFPDDAMLWLNRGVAEENLNHLSDALVRMEQAVALNPNLAEAWGNLSNIRRKLKNFGEAEIAACRALVLGVNRAEGLNALGLSLARQGKFSDAEAALTEAHALSPHKPDILANRANLAVDQLKFDAAWPLFAAARAMEDKAVYRRDEGMARILSGDTARGWELYEARLEMA